MKRNGAPEFRRRIRAFPMPRSSKLPVAPLMDGGVSRDPRPIPKWLTPGIYRVYLAGLFVDSRRRRPASTPASVAPWRHSIWEAMACHRRFTRRPNARAGIRYL